MTQQSGMDRLGSVSIKYIFRLGIFDFASIDEGRTIGYYELDCMALILVIESENCLTSKLMSASPSILDNSPLRPFCFSSSILSRSCS